MSQFEDRVRLHDELEDKVMDFIRKFTTRKHMPDRFISLRDRVVAWDFKTSNNVEEASRNEYFRLLEKDGIPVFIVYKVGKQVYAEWIQNLTWKGSFAPTSNSTSGDRYFKIDGGVKLSEFMEREK